MKIHQTRMYLSALAAGLLLVCVAHTAVAQTPAPDIKPYIISAEQTERGMTLWQMIVAGGAVMIVLGILSLAALAITVYEFMTLKVAILAPKKFSEEIIQRLEKKEFKAAKKLCNANPNNIISRIVSAGLEKIESRAIVAREAMENAARKEIGDLWQTLSYLADIANIAPLLGLLGTVLGMIQAFSVIVVQSSGVKPILLAAGVSKAMITTAAGLMVAIPVMLVYSYFRAKVQEVSNVVEIYSTDIIKIIDQSKQQGV